MNKPLLLLRPDYQAFALMSSNLQDFLERILQLLPTFPGSDVFPLLRVERECSGSPSCSVCFVFLNLCKLSTVGLTGESRFIWFALALIQFVVSVFADLQRGRDANPVTSHLLEERRPHDVGEPHRRNAVGVRRQESAGDDLRMQLGGPGSLGVTFIGGPGASKRRLRRLHQRLLGDLAASRWHFSPHFHPSLYLTVVSAT